MLLDTVGWLTFDLSVLVIWNWLYYSLTVVDPISTAARLSPPFCCATLLGRAWWAWTIWRAGREGSRGRRWTPWTSWWAWETRLPCKFILLCKQPETTNVYLLNYICSDRTMISWLSQHVLAFSLRRGLEKKKGNFSVAQTVPWVSHKRSSFIIVQIIAL